MNSRTPDTLLDFTGRVVVVTGASQGIGAGIAMRFAEAGADVVVNYNTNDAGAQDVVSHIKGIGRSAISVQANVSQRADVDRLIAQAVESFGRLDVMVNNAGLQPLAMLLDMTEDDWDQVIEVNLRGVFLCTQAVAKQFIAGGDAGAIVNIASIEAENPAPMHSHYNASKAGVVMYTRASANELGQHGIRVNAVSPGLIWRDGIEEAWPDGVERWQKAAALTRLGQPDDVADACLFLASSAARWITGVNLVVDGGVMTKQIF
jgi:NAD(P)-dependent dehydrogenase (short-subunit alcohol dehydrogenase family)